MLLQIIQVSIKNQTNITVSCGVLCTEFSMMFYKHQFGTKNDFGRIKHGKTYVIVIFSFVLKNMKKLSKPIYDISYNISVLVKVGKKI